MQVFICHSTALLLQATLEPLVDCELSMVLGILISRTQKVLGKWGDIK